MEVTKEMRQKLINCFEKNVRVITKSGFECEGLFINANSEYDNDGPATITVGKWELEEQEIKDIFVIEKKDTKK